MTTQPVEWPKWQRPLILLAINLLFLTVWGVTGWDKIRSGIPPWFGDKFGATWLAVFPGLKASLWILAVSEVAAFLLALGALVKLEFVGRARPVWLATMLVFVQLSLGQWVSKEYTGSHMIFM
ncbi:MAG: hypothetical protein FJ404_03175 [Verrucomicrobia bacterium]|nr:hypothetical protein [Verrucomicrobiota bacterium]